MIEIKEARSVAITALEKAQDRETQALSMFQEHQIGDQVWLDARHLKQKMGSPKLSPRWYGPFSVATKLSKVAYQLDLPETWNVHNAFHASLLTKYKETPEHGPNFTQPPLEIINDELEWEVETITDDRTWGRWKKKQYKVRWLGYAPAHDSWVDEKDLHTSELVVEYEARKGIKARAAEVEIASLSPWIPHLSGRSTNPLPLGTSTIHHQVPLFFPLPPLLLPPSS